MFEKVDAAMDEPWQLLYPEVLERFPEAKFVYFQSEPDHWYASYIRFVRHTTHLPIVAKGINMSALQTSSRLRGVIRHHQPRPGLEGLNVDAGCSSRPVHDLGCYMGCTFGWLYQG